MFSTAEIEAKVDEQLAMAEAAGQSVVILARADWQNGKVGASLYAYKRLGDHFDAGAFVHWDPVSKVEGGVQIKYSF